MERSDKTRVGEDMNRIERLKKGIDFGHEKYDVEKSKTGMYMATVYLDFDVKGEPDPESGIEERGNYCSVCLFLEDEPYNFGDVIEPSTYDADCDDCCRESLWDLLMPIPVTLPTVPVAKQITNEEEEE